MCVCALLWQTRQYVAEEWETRKATAAKLPLTEEELEGLLDQLPPDGPAPEDVVKVRISMLSEFESP